MRLPVWFALVIFPAAANDTLATLGAGGLIPLKSSQIAMEREDLAISVHQITVRYLFRNQTDHDIDATVAFPLPELEGPMVEHVPLALPSKKTNFVDFAVQVAGKPVTTNTEVRAFSLDGRDITDRMRAAGAPLSVIDEHFEDIVRKMSPQKRRPLEKEDLVLSDDGGKTWWPGWKTKVQFYWTQHFPARNTMEVQHTYRPVVGGAFITANDTGASTVKPYCGGPDTLPRIQDVKRRHPLKAQDQPALLEKQIRYILTTANNWSGPIRDFHLTVTAETADDIVMTCMPGLKRTAATRYQLDRTAYHPDADLDLLILTPGPR